MPSESIHKKLSRVRKPHVHITYEVEIGDAVEVKELPFIVGVMGDYTGNNPGQSQKSLEDRKFTDIDRDNFNDILKRMAPGLNIRVENTLADDGTELAVQLKFESLDDFTPAKVVEQVEPLKKLLEARNRLQELQSHADKKAKLEEVLEEILGDADKIKALASELKVGEGSDK